MCDANVCYLRTLIASAAVLAFLRAGIVVAQPPAPDKLLVAMRSDSAELVSFERSETNYQCRATMKQKERAFERVLQVRRTGDSALIETENGNKRGCLNTKYMFGVERNQQEGQWKLIEFIDTDPVPEFDRNVGQYRYILFPLTSIGGSGTLQEKIDNPKFHLTATRLRPDGAIRRSRHHD